MPRFLIERHPSDPPFSEAQLRVLAQALPDPAIAMAESLVVSLTWWRAPFVVTPPVELPNDAGGYPPPPLEGFVIAHHFVRKHLAGRGWYWYCVPQ